MPDHFHAIIQIDNGRVGGNASVGDGLKLSPTDTQPSKLGMQPTKHGLAEFVRALKTFSVREINELRKNARPTRLVTQLLRTHYPQ